MTLLASLPNRIFVASALLLVVAMGTVISRVNVSVASQAEADLNAGLSDAASLVDELSRTQFADFIVKGELIADLPVLKGAAATDHAPTVQPVARDQQARVTADLFVVTGANDRVLASVARLQPSETVIAGLLAACRTGIDAAAFLPVGDGVLHAVAIPLTPLATLLVGVSLDRQAAERMKLITNSEIAFTVTNRLVTSTLDPVRAAELSAHLARGDVSAVWLGGEPYIGLRRTLDRAGSRDAPAALVLRSRTEHLRFLSRLHWQIVLTGFAAVLVATLVGYGIARTVTRPLRGLTATMREMAATGDLARPAPAVGHWDDEDAASVA